MTQSEKTLRYMYLKQMAQEIRKVRSELGMSQVELGNAVGISGFSVSMWETAKNFPTMLFIEKLEKLGAKFTLEQKACCMQSNRKALEAAGQKRLNWLHDFRVAFTRRNAPDKAEGYEGDEWKIVKGEFIKPSQVEDFIEKLLTYAKGGVDNNGSQ